jgi:hypothetical protein
MLDDEAIKTFHANVSSRARLLQRYESFVECTQYEDRKTEWFDDGEQSPPLLERKPCIVYPAVKSAIDSNVDLCLSEGRYPAVTALRDDTDDGQDIDEDSAALVDSLLVQIGKQAKLRRVFRAGMAQAQAVGSVPVICGIRGKRRKRLVADIERAQWCTPKLDADGCVTELEVRYPYLVERKVNGQCETVTMLYRRVIDAERDVTYKPALADKDGREPVWTEDPALTVQHGFGFCPVVWYAHMLGPSTVNRFDGHPLHERLLDEVFAVDVALSQRHRAAFFSADPQWVATGVDPDTGGPVADGRPVVGDVLSTPNGGPPGPGNRPTGLYDRPWRVPSVAGQPGSAMKKGPNRLWKFDGADVKVTQHTLPGDALKGISEHAADLIGKLSQSMAVVFMDPQDVKFAATVSGKALASIKARQLDRCDQYRDDMEDGLIVPVVQMLMTIAYQRAGDLKLPGLRAARAVLSRFVDGGIVDMALQLKWGEYFKPDPAEDKQLIDVARVAKEAGLATTKVAVQKIARVLGIENVDQYLDELAEEREEHEACEYEREHALINAANGPAVGRNRAATAGDEEGPTSDRGSGTATTPTKGRATKQPRESRA